MSNKDYYKVLGVARSADTGELKRAFREKARNNHPDKIKDLPEDEKERRIELMYEVNEAYEVLSDADKRKEYDRFGREGYTKHSREGTPRGSGASTTQAQRKSEAYENMFDAWFGENGISGEKGVFSRTGGSFNEGSNIFGSAFKRKDDDYFLIPENDWGLLVALKKAYESKEDGKWRVKKAESEERDYVPDEIYSVKRENGQVYVFRKIVDWRDKWDREKGIKVREEGSYTKIEKTMSPTTFLGEYYLTGKGKDRLEMVSFDIPYNFGEYLDAMKSLAHKFAKKTKNGSNNYDVAVELAIINRYTNVYAKKVRVEGSLLWADDKNREWVKKISFENFWGKMEQSEVSVTQVEGANIKKEAESKVASERAKHGDNPEG